MLSTYLPDKKSLEFHESTKVKTVPKAPAKNNKSLKCNNCLKLFSTKGPFKLHTVSCNKKRAESDRRNKENGEPSQDHQVSLTGMSILFH